MSAQLNVMTQGVQGKKKHIKEQGQVYCFIDDDDSNMLTDGSLIAVDSFIGQGPTYQRRQYCEITIKHNGGIWRGSIGALAKFLKLDD